MTTTTPTDKSDKEIPEYCQVLQFKDSNGQVKEMLFPKGLDLDRPKRPRTTFSESQLSVLETEFTRNQYLVGKDRTRLAKELKLSETQIKVWFQNRRTKSKRDNPSGKSPELSQMKSPAASNAATAHAVHSGFTDITSVAPLLSPVEFTSATQQQLHTSTMLNAYGKLLASVMTTPYPGLSYMPNFPIANFNYMSPTPNFKSDSDGQT